jgi:hypothetical protein
MGSLATGEPIYFRRSMVELFVVGLILIVTLLISMFLAIVNWKIYIVTVKMLSVTIDIYVQTLELLNYTKKTYEVLGGEEGVDKFRTR